MSSTKPTQSNFSAGEIASNLLGRIDHERYQNGILRGENCVVTPQGSLSKRNGTKAVHAFNVTDEDIALSFGDGRSDVTGCRTIPIVFSATEAYVLILVKTTTGVKGYIYSNNNLDLLKYQTNDDEVKVVNGVIQVEVLTIPNWNNNGTITLDANTYFFDHTETVGDQRNAYAGEYTRKGILKNRVTGEPYQFPGVPNSYIRVERLSSWKSNKGTVPARWYMTAGSNHQTPANITKWAYQSTDGSDLEFPLTNWTLSSWVTIGTAQTWGLNKETTRYSVNTEITIGDGFSFNYLARELNEIDYTVYDNSIILTHRNHKPIVISRGKKRNTVSGVDDYRQWTARVFTFNDGPYLETDKGKQLPSGAGAQVSDQSITLRLKKNSDVSILRSNDPYIIENQVNLAINDYVEYKHNDNILLGKIVVITNDSLIVESHDPTAINVDNKAVLESDWSVIDSVTMLFSDTAIWSKSIEGNYFRYQQQGSSGLETAWFRIDRYVGQKIFTSSHTDGNDTVRTWQAKVSGSYNNLHQSTQLTMDAVEVTRITSKIHFCVDGVTGSGSGSVDTLSDGESVFLSERVISYNVTSDRHVFHYTRDKGRYIRFELNGEWCWGRIYEVIVNYNTSDWVSSTSYSVGDWVLEDEKYYICTTAHNSGTFATDLAAGNWEQRFNAKEVNVTLDIPPPIVRNGKEQFSTNVWQFGCYHDASGETDDDDEANYPSVVEVIDDRVFFGGGNLTPDLWHLSSSNDYRNFGPTDEFGEVLATSAISYRLPTGAGMIKWVSSAQNLIIGTTTGEYKVATSEDLATLTPTNIYVRKQTDFGSFSNSALTIDGSIIFIAAPGKTIRELTYSFQNDSYRSVNISVVAQHLFSNADPIQDMAYISHPNNLILFRTKRGRLIALTYDKENRIVAACPWSISGLKPYGDDVGDDPADGYDVKRWATATEYHIGECVSHNGIYFQCLETHTSNALFEVDYINSLWLHTGAPVVSMCSLPSSDGRSSDKFFMATYRNLSYTSDSDVITDTSDQNFLCLEILEPYSVALADSYYKDREANSFIPIDFHVIKQDLVDGSYGVIQLGSTPPFETVNDLATANNSNLKRNSHMSLLGDQVPYHGDITEGNGNRLEGFGLISFGYSIKTGVFPRLHEMTNALIGQTESIINVQNVDCKRTENITGGRDTYLFFANPDGESGYTYPYGDLTPSWACGFIFPCVITPLPLEFIGAIEQGGGSIGRVRRLNKVDLLVEDTGPFSIISESMYEHNSDNYQFTGIVEADLDFGNDERQQFSIVSFSANRLNLLSIGTELDIKK